MTRTLRLIVGLAVIVLGVSVAVVTLVVSRDDPSPTTPDFYAAPADLPDAPGELVRQEAFTRGVPDTARGWRILYTTTRADGSIGVASGLVVTPTARAPDGGFPVIAWTHGTTGVARACAPSLLADPFGAGGLDDVGGVVGLGWAVVATDYPGLGTAGTHPFLVGRPEAWSELDAVRAARSLSGAGLGRQTVAWGHSQGGGAALWAGIEAADYAPDVPLAGVAALAPASDLVALAAALRDSGSGTVFGPFLVSGYAAVYPDVTFDDYVSADARSSARRIVQTCLTDSATLDRLVATLDGRSIWGRDPTTGSLPVRLEQNTPSEVSGVPTFIGQGDVDTLVLPAAQRSFVSALCRAGQPVDYHHYPGLDHTTLITDPAGALPTDLVAWTTARFAGRTAATRCTSTAG